MGLTVLLGAQWGDEGKGRITDALASRADVVARFKGGDNAGHSITIGSRVVKLHAVPSGIFREGCINVIGNGVVLNPRNLLREIAEIEAAGLRVTPARLRISPAAHIILPGHSALDAARERTRGGIGTTQRGIGFAYMDKASRVGLRAGAMRDPAAFGRAVEAHTISVNRTLTAEYGAPPLDAARVGAEYAEAAAALGLFVADTFALVHATLARGGEVLAEGAQGVLLDIDHGTYPYVTSSSTTIGGVLTGLGLPAQAVTRVVGVAKAFTSRVGAGPFPTELEGDQAKRLRGTGENAWDEYGSTTGRPRRVGWFDAVAVAHAVRLNGITELALTKMDVLSGLPELRIATGYTLDGVRLDGFPEDADAMARLSPVYETLPGWTEDIAAARRVDALPAAALGYARRIEALTGARISVLSVGPERDQMMTLPA